MKAKTILAAVLTILVMLSVQTAMGSQVVEDGLVGYWTFNQADIEGGIAKDVYGNNDGIMVGEPETVEGKFGEALQFNGVDDYVEIPDDESLQLWTSYTLEAWIYQIESRSSN